MSKPGLFLWKKALKHSKEYFVSDCLKWGKSAKKWGFSYLDSEKKPSAAGGVRPLTPPTRGIAPELLQGPSMAPGPSLSGSLTFLHSHLCYLSVSVSVSVSLSSLSLSVTVSVSVCLCLRDNNNSNDNHIQKFEICCHLLTAM